MTVTTNERGQINMFANEPRMQRWTLSVTHETYAELQRNNGRVAMLGFVAGVVSYAFSGSIFFFGAFGI